MDPHSRFSQFNTRQTKAGPIAGDPYHIQPFMKSVNPLEEFRKRPTPSSRPSKTPGPSLLESTRPIATNSRIKQDEQYRKDMHLAYVTNALQQQSRGNKEAFEDLVDQFNHQKTTNERTSTSVQLRLWILALSNVVSRLERCHSPLIEAVVAMPWTTMDTNFVKTYTSFIGILVSAKPEYLSMVLGKLSYNLTYHSGLQALDSGIAEGSSSPLTRRVVYERTHFLLRHLLSLVPTLPSTLQPLLVRNFPHKRQNQAAQVTYIRNLLSVMEYCPELADSILATIIDRAIQIDVEIQVEVEDLEERLAACEDNDIFELDPFDTLVGQEEESDSDDGDDEGDALSDLSSDAGGGDAGSDDSPDVPSDYKHIQEMVNKLDAILKLVFDHFNHTHSSIPPTPVPSRADSPSRSPSEKTPPSPDSLTLPEPSPVSIEHGKYLRRSQFYVLLSIFDRIILRTFKSRYTQFLIFWYSSLDPEFSDTFQGTLISKALLEEDQPTVTRAVAASYIGSFVSRAEFVDGDSTRRVVGCLCDFLKSRLEMWEASQQPHTGVEVEMGDMTVFYAVAQAVFLVFCFRWRDLLAEGHDGEFAVVSEAPRSKWIKELDVLRRVVVSDLNPLKVCASAVVEQFAKVAHATDFLYCYPILEANRRSEFGKNSSQSPKPSDRNRAQDTHNRHRPTHVLFGHNAVHRELNTYFPFDPYKLPRSLAYIEGIYREWSSVAIEDDEGDEEEDSEVEDVPEEEGSKEGAIAVNEVRVVGVDDPATEGLGASFGGMSISPMGSVIPGVPMSVS